MGDCLIQRSPKERTVDRPGHNNGSDNPDHHTDPDDDRQGQVPTDEAERVHGDRLYGVRHALRLFGSGPVVSARPCGHASCLSG